MSKVVFTVQYEVKEDQLNNYFQSIREMKSLVKTEGLEQYSVYQVKGKKNTFAELFVFRNAEFYEQYEDNIDERLSVLLSKIETLKVHGTTRYTTQEELPE